MKVNFDYVFRQISGEEIPNPNKTSEHFTLRLAAVNALVAANPKEQISGDEKVKRYLLATRIFSGDDELELTAEEAALVKKVIGDGFGAVIVGQAWGLLDGK